MNCSEDIDISILFHGSQIKTGAMPVCYHLVENPNPHHIDRSYLLTFATALNLCYQRNLFQLHKHCQSIFIIEILQTSARDQNQQLETTKKMLDDLRIRSSRELIQQVNETNSMDWKTISEISMNNQYSEKYCRHAWQQLCLPVINYYQNWSPEEDQLLENLVQIHGVYADQWTSIVSNFPHRSAYMCASRYMFLENNRLTKIKFCSDQIHELKEVIEEDCHRNYISLNKVDYKFGCSLSTIRREWRNIDPNARRGQ